MIRLFDQDLVWDWPGWRNVWRGIATERTEYADELLSWAGIGAIVSGIGLIALAVISASR